MAIWDKHLKESMRPVAEQQMGDVVRYGTGVVQWSIPNDPHNFTPRFIRVSPRNFWLAQKILRGRGWHYKNTARWRYLVRRGARK